MTSWLPIKGIIILLLTMGLCSISTASLRTGVVIKNTNRAEGYLQHINPKLETLRTCLQEYHNDNEGILASSSTLTSLTCPILCANELNGCDYNTTTGRICIKTSDKSSLEEINDKILICDPAIDTSAGTVDFLGCSCKHNIKWNGTLTSTSDNTKNTLIENVGPVNCLYDSSITSCD